MRVSRVVLACCAMALAAAPAFASARPIVPRARSADNAKKVNGIRASRIPKPNRLLPLDAQGKFPAAVLPAILAGPTGPKGDPGPPGPPGSPGGGGTITSVITAAGSGLIGGGTTGDVTLDTDLSILQKRLSAPCGAGTAITAIAQSGAPTCDPFGDITDVVAGAGLAGGASSGVATLALAPPLDLVSGGTAPTLASTATGSGAALRGVATGPASQVNNGVEGFSGTKGSGVYGESSSTNGFGVAGRVTGTGGGTAIFGDVASGASCATCRAGLFNGDVVVNGTLSKAGGSFKIDDPRDPANRYLQHSFVESPDMMDVYDGNVTTNNDGYATVRLPEWFEPLNRDFRYQLTPIHSFAQAAIWRGIHANRFTIRTTRPHVRLSWQVTGIRHDAWANAHRIPTETFKPKAERGRYLAPAELGKPTRLAIIPGRR